MRLLEYQAKELFKEFGIRTPESISSTDIENNVYKNDKDQRQEPESEYDECLSCQ